MLSKTKISICVPVYNTEKYLFLCLESIAKQVSKENQFKIEVIVVDDSGMNNARLEDSHIKYENDNNTKHINDNVQVYNNNVCETLFIERCKATCLPTGRTKQSSAQQIIKMFKKVYKKQKISVKFIAHEENKGLIETRRTALYESSGEYIMFVDSDDFLPNDSIKTLFEVAQKTDADIVQGKTNICWKKEGRCGDSSPLEGEVENATRLERGEGFPPLLKNRINEMNKKSNSVFVGELFENQIFDAFLFEGKISGFLWGKIFTRKICLEAFSQIPPTYCTFGEDFLTFFFLSRFAKKYVGIENIVYNYFIDSGISSNKKIESLEEWQKICSTASVFTILFSWIDENQDKITKNEVDKVRELCIFYAKNNLAQLKKAVATELQGDAYKMLCDFWGENMIKKVDL